MSILQTFCTRKGSGTKNPGSIWLLLGFLLIVVFFANLVLGPTSIDLKEALWGTDLNSASRRILLYVRLPRALAAILSGSALAVAGVIIQNVLDNPLAAPNIIGVNAGAGFTALLIIGLFPGIFKFMPAAAMIGAFGASLLIYAIASRTGAGRVTITLAGIAVSSIFTAGMNTVKTLLPESIYNASTFLIGGFSGISYGQLSPAWMIILLALVVAWLLSADMDILALGEEMASNVGLKVKNIQFVLLMVASLLAGAAVSFAGLLGFVGLIVPHIMRRLVGTKHRRLIPASLMGGGIFVLVCDLASRLIFMPYEIPVGIIMSLTGGPFFIMLLLQRRNKT